MPAKRAVAQKAPLSAEKSPNATKEHLIDIGLDLMRKRGYGATGLQDILESARVPKGSFYHHFGSKEEFASAVIERYFTMSAAHCTGLLSNTRQRPLRRLRRYFEELIQLAGQTAPIKGCLLGSFSLEVAPASMLLQERLSSSFTQWQSVVASVLQEAVDTGDLDKSVKAGTLAGFILNSWEGALLRSQADKSDAPLKDFVHYVFDELLTN
jgi:TetR/AcrR family transcriptional repressor of nem operon